MATFTPNPVIGIDISRYNYRVDVPLLLDAGVKVFVVKIGQNSTLDPNFYKHADNISKYTAQGAVLQCYYWDEITSSSIFQASWVTNEIKKSGYPIKFTWIDAEQWWTDWSKYYQAVSGTLPYSSVPRLSPENLSSHYQQTHSSLRGSLGADRCGVYSNKAFIEEFAPYMANWYANEKVKMWIPYYGWQSQPRVVTVMSWNEWKGNWFPLYTPPIPNGTSYSEMKGHQCTGDVCKVPGVYSNVLNALSATDINVFDGAWLSSLNGTTPPPIPDPIPQNRYVAIYTLNIYATSDHQPPIIGYLPINTEVVVYEVVGNYARIGVSKWVYYPYLKPVVVTPPVPIPVNQYASIYNLNIHISSDPSSPIIGILPANTRVTVYEIVGDYARIDTGKWVYYPYLHKVT